MISQSSFFSKFQNRRFKEAADSIAKKSEKPGKNQILFLLDRGTALFEAGEYKEAIDVFTKAERLSEIKDYTSISEEVVSIVTTDRYKQFRPLDFERIMINVYLALSYFMIEKYEDALVECRRINNLIYNLKNKGMKKFEESPLAWYLSALIYEIQKKHSDALIDYRRAKKLKPNFKLILSDLRRTCSSCGEVVILFSTGLIPIKRVNPVNTMLPRFYTRSQESGYLTIDLKGKKLTRTYEIMDLEDVARKNLEERIDRIMAKRVLGIGTKVAIGYGVAKATKSNTLGILTGLLLHATTAPDLRSWSTLPRSFQIARFKLTKGKHEITFRHRIDGSGISIMNKKVNIVPGSIHLIILRSFL